MSEWGWSDKDKREEMTDEKSWYLVAWDLDQNNAPVAAVHFRFDMDNDDEVLYWLVLKFSIVFCCDFSLQLFLL